MAATLPAPDFGKLPALPRNWMIGAVATLVVHAVLLVVLVLARVDRMADPEPTMEVALVPVSAFAPADLKRPAAAPTPKSAPTPPELEKARPTPTPEVMPDVVRAAAAAPSPTPSETPAPTAVAAAPAGPPAPAITAPNFTAAYLNNPGPQYPYESRVKRQEGLVKLRVLVSADGRADEVLIDRSSGFAALDQAALDVVKRRWRFVPAKQDGRPIQAWVIVPLAFSVKTR